MVCVSRYVHAVFAINIVWLSFTAAFFTPMSLNLYSTGRTARGISHVQRMSSEGVRHIKTLIEQRTLMTPFSIDSLCTLDYLAALMEVSSPACAKNKSEESEFACTVTEEYASLYKRSKNVHDACTKLKAVSRGAPIKHAVFVLLDGYGWNLLKAFSNLKLSLNSKSFIAEHSEGRPPARTVFPATTAAALSSYGSLRLPAHHAQWGWRVRLAKNGQVVQPLAGDFTFSDSLVEDDVFKFRSVFPRLSTDEGRMVCGFSAYGGSPFSDRMCGKDTPHVFNGEMSINDAIPALQTFWASADAKETSTFAYVYSANPDKVEHVCGPFDSKDSTVISAGVLESIEQLDEQMRILCEETQPDNKRMILMMADHGQYNVQQYVTLPANLRAMFETMTVEPATPSFHLKPSTTREAFREAWEAAGLTRYWQLLDQEELLATGLLGPELSPEARETLGDLTGIALGPYLLELGTEDSPRLAQKLWGMIKSKGVLGTVSSLWEMRGLLWKLKAGLSGSGKYHHSGHHGGAQQCEVEVPVFVWAD